jgi:amidase
MDESSLSELSIADIHSLVASKHLTYAKLTSHFLERVARYNGLVNAVIELNPRALKDAADADERASKDASLCQGMFGIPLLVKDNVIVDAFDSKDPAREIMNMSVGSLALIGARWKREASLVTKLRAVGAVILGSTNMSGWFQRADQGDMEKRELKRVPITQNGPTFDLPRN